MSCIKYIRRAPYIFRLQRILLAEASKPIPKVLYCSLRPTPFTRRDNLFYNCFNNLRKAYMNIIPSRLVVGKKNIHFGSGTSIIRPRISVVRLESPERSYIFQWTFPHLIKYLKRVCIPYWNVEKRRRISEKMSTYLAEPIIDHPQGIGMYSKPRPKRPDNTEVPTSPSRPEGPLPSFPVPGLPEVAIPVAPQCPADVPAFPVKPKVPLPGNPSPIIPEDPLPGNPMPIVPEPISVNPQSLKAEPNIDEKRQDRS